jgi:tetratricopeptide (TPR) repeat protein
MITDSQQTSSPDIEAYLAMQLLKDGNRQAAVDKCHQAIVQYGPNRNLYLVKARAHLELEEYGFAQEALLSLLSLDPEHPAGWALLGEAYYQLGNMPKVDYCRNRLKQIFPTLVEPDEEEESDSAGDVSGQATRHQEESADASGTETCRHENDTPVGQGPRGLDDSPVGQADSRPDDIPVIAESEPRGFGSAENPVGQARSGLDDIPATASGIIVPEAQVADISNNPPSNTENGEPAVSIVPLEEVADTQTPSEQPLSELESIPAGGIVDELIEADLRINEQMPATSRINVEIFETATFADICLAQGKYEKALDIYTKLSILHPDNESYREKINIIKAKMGSR